ncbi:MAG: hypothetical protein IPN79_17475 [Saprospiraceae bacterium]|nr:hypothetical protein [Saprospiraceae bacterium]
MAITADEVLLSTQLLQTNVPVSPRPELTYLTPKEADCHWQDPNGPWNNPGPAAGPFTADLGDGTTVTYYWYRFCRPAVRRHANLPEICVQNCSKVELIHANWHHTDEYLAPPSVGRIATLDPAVIVQPPAGLEIGYVPIVTRQEKSKSKVRVFVMAGQSNMEGYGTIEDAENDPGSLADVIRERDSTGEWSTLGQPGNWTVMDNVYLHFARNGETIKSSVTVGQELFQI